MAKIRYIIEYEITETKQLIVYSEKEIDEVFDEYVPIVERVEDYVRESLTVSEASDPNDKVTY